MNRAEASPVFVTLISLYPGDLDPGLVPVAQVTAGLLLSQQTAFAAFLLNPAPFLARPGCLFSSWLARGPHIPCVFRVAQACVYQLVVGIDAEVAAAVKKVDQPAATAQAAAADIQYFGLREETLVEEVDEEVAPGDFKMVEPVPQGQTFSLDLLRPIDQ